MRILWRVFGYMLSLWFKEVLVYACMLGLNGVRLVTPQLIQSVVDVGINQGQRAVLARDVLFLLLATVVQVFMRFGQGYLAETVAQGVAFTMRNEIYRKLQSLSFTKH